MNTKCKWSKHDLEVLAAMYPHHPTCAVAQVLCRRISPVQRMAQMLGIKKTPEALGDIRRAAEKKIGANRSSRFKPRHGRATEKSGSYLVWLCMNQRCTYPKHKSFSRYGGRGIVVCERWATYEHFHADMGDPPFNGATLGRIDNDGNYEPWNCRWETVKQQARNRRSNRLVTAWGETQCLAAWAERFGIRSDTLADRLSRGAVPEVALTKPVSSRSVA